MTCGAWIMHEGPCSLPKGHEGPHDIPLTDRGQASTAHSEGGSLDTCRETSTPARVAAPSQEWDRRVELARQRVSDVSFRLAALSTSESTDHGRFTNEIRMLREAVDLLDQEVKFA